MPKQSRHDVRSSSVDAMIPGTAGSVRVGITKSYTWLKSGLASGLALALVLAVAGHGSDAAANAAPNARQIMDKVATARMLDGSEAVVTMTIKNGKGQKRVRKLSLATKLFEGGKTEKRIYRFLEPADVKGSGVLVFDYATKEDDTWIFLPALRKTRRIVSSKKSKAFMGSEFSYADLNFPNLADFTFTLKPNEKVRGADCYVIESKPKSKKIASGEGYSRKTLWVAKADHTVRRAKYYDLKGKPLKELNASKIKLLDKSKKRYRTMHLEMKNLQNGRSSTFDTAKIVFTPKTKDEYFTTRYLERP